MTFFPWPAATGNAGIDNLVSRSLRLGELADGLGDKLPNEVRETIGRVCNAMDNDAESWTDAGVAELTRHVNEALARIS